MTFTKDQMDALYDEAEAKGLDLATASLPKLAEAIRADAKHKAHALFAGAAAPEATGLADMPAPRGEPTTATTAGTTPKGAARAETHLPAKAATHLPSATATPITGLEGLEGLSREHVRMPSMKIRQGTTQGDGIDGVPLGALFLSFDPAGHASKRVVRVLDIAPGRSFLLPYGKSNEATQKKADLRSRLSRERGFNVPDDAMAVCSSRDGKKPHDRGYGTLSPACKGCPFSQWRTGMNGKRMPPECGDEFRLLLLDEASQAPARFTVRKTAIDAVKNLAANLIIAGKGKVPPAGFRLTLETAKDSDGSNTWYVPKFGKLEPVSDAEREEGLAMRRGVIGNPAVDLDEDEHADGGA